MRTNQVPVASASARLSATGMMSRIGDQSHAVIVALPLGDDLPGGIRRFGIDHEDFEVFPILGEDGVQTRADAVLQRPEESRFMELASLPRTLQRHQTTVWVTFVFVATMTLLGAFLPPERFEATSVVAVQPASAQVSTELLHFLIPSLEARASGSALAVAVDQGLPPQARPANREVKTIVPAGSGVMSITVISDNRQASVTTANAYARFLATRNLGTPALRVLVIDSATKAKQTTLPSTLILSGLALGVILVPLAALARGSWGLDEDDEGPDLRGGMHTDIPGTVPAGVAGGPPGSSVDPAHPARHWPLQIVPFWSHSSSRSPGGRPRLAQHTTQSSAYDIGASAAAGGSALALPQRLTPEPQLSPAPWHLPELVHPLAPSVAMLGDVELWLAATENGDARLLREGLRGVAASWPTRCSPAAELTRRLSRETQSVENGWRNGRLPAQEVARRLAAVVGEIDVYWRDRSALPPEAARTVRQIVRAALGTPHSPSAVNDLVRGARLVRDALGSHWAGHGVRWKKRESESADLLSQVVAWQREQTDVGRMSKTRSRASAAALHSLIVQIDGFFATRWEEARADGAQLALRLAALGRTL